MAPEPHHATGPSAQLGSATWEALGTSVVLRVSGSTALVPARAAVECELAAIDMACSRFREDSELSRLNAQAGRWTRASPLLIEALEVALRAAELTGGDVDPTVGRDLELAGYDRDWRLLAPAPGVPGEPPRPVAVRARLRSGWRTISLDRRSCMVRLAPGIRLDLGATAKAWAADRAARAASEAAACGVLVSVGGDVATCGEGPAGGWRIRVTDDHRDDRSGEGQLISIRSGGIATSSTAVRRWAHGGETMHHIIDPATGQPVRGPWRTASAAAADCTDANIATTAALVRADDAPAWLEQVGLPARLVDWQGNVTTVGRWP
ncbi:MAG: FAD:protein transferase [Solirubrobacteraceae bacterium]|nr:FAD:protein transferase [Solirubrobacteraceae bacterium]